MGNYGVLRYSWADKNYEKEPSAHSMVLRIPDLVSFTLNPKP